MTAHRQLLRTGLCCLLAITSGGPAAQAQTYPTGPVKFITQLSAGSGTDPAMRVVIEQLGRIWKRQTVLINQPGAGGALAVRAVRSAAPDGHTLYMAIASTFTVLPITQPNLSLDVNEFVPIGFVGEVPIAIATSASLPVGSLGDLIELSKRRPGGLNVAVGTRGGVTHLTTELLRSRSGADLTTVIYPGAAQATADVVSGRVPILIDGLAGPITGPQFKLLGIASSERQPSHPGVPTVSETVPGFAATGWFVLVAPAGTPAAKELSAFIAAERTLWRPVVMQLGLATQ